MERPTKKIWTEEDELEFQIGDMNGIAFKDEEFVVYQTPDEKRSCDKTDHAERSKANQPNHKKHKGKAKHRPK